MNRANLTAIEKRIAAAEIVHHQRVAAYVVLKERRIETDADRDAWGVRLVRATQDTDLVVVIRNFGWLDEECG